MLHLTLISNQIKHSVALKNKVFIMFFSYETRQNPREKRILVYKGVCHVRPFLYTFLIIVQYTFSMQHNNSNDHFFHNCPLRSSSLMIVNKEKQTIVTATDEVFNMLGYEPIQLVGKSVSILNPTKHKQRENCYYLLHESYGKTCFELCIHFDPLTNATDLEYWLLRPIAIQRQSALVRASSSPSTGPVTILRLSPFGTIEHAYPSLEFPQTPHDLRGQPIMSFVHQSDVRSLCEKLSKIPQRVYTTFRIRWLKAHPKHGEEQQYKWVSFTVMNNPRRSSCSSLYDPQSRPVCIIRPLYQEEDNSQHQSPSSGILGFAFNMLVEQTNFGVNTLYQTLESLHLAIDQGKSYLIEFLAHLITQILTVTCELVGHLEGKSNDEKNNIPAVNVSLDNCVWAVPLYIKKTMTMQQQHASKTKRYTKRKSSKPNKSLYTTYWSSTTMTPTTMDTTTKK